MEEEKTYKYGKELYMDKLEVLCKHCLCVYKYGQTYIFTST